MVMKHSEREREEKREKNKKMVRKQRELSALCLFVCLFVCVFGVGRLLSLDGPRCKVYSVLFEQGSL